MADVEFQANGGTAPGYLATPESGSGPAVVVLQEWWGLDGHIKDVCDRLASEGFFALAPDLYRGETADQPDEAEQKMMAMSMDQAEKDMRGAVDFLAAQDGVEGDGVGSVGFCLGGGLSVWAATVNPKVDAVVTYYYVMPHGKPDFSKIDAPVLGPLRHSRRFRAGGRREGAAGGDRERLGPVRGLRVLRGCRPRLLQRHGSPGHPRQGCRAAVVGAHPGLPALEPRVSFRAGAAAAALLCAAGLAAGCGGDEEEPEPQDTGARRLPGPRSWAARRPSRPARARREVGGGGGARAEAPDGGTGSPEDQPGGAGDEIPARSQALISGRGGRLSPRLVRVPPFISVRVELRSTDGARYSLRGGGKTLTVGGRCAR